jgi:hypothetical protein
VVQVAHAAAVQLLEWLPHSNAMSRDLLCDSLTVLGATAGCAAGADAAQRLTDTLKGVKERLPPRLATELNPRLQAAMVGAHAFACAKDAVESIVYELVWPKWSRL